MLPSFHTGRFALLNKETGAYITSWDTWEEAQVAFPLPDDAVLLDDLTGVNWTSEHNERHGSATIDS